MLHDSVMPHLKHNGITPAACSALIAVQVMLAGQAL